MDKKNINPKKSFSHGSAAAEIKKSRMSSGSYEEIIAQIDKYQIDLSRKEILLKIYQAQNHAKGLHNLIEEIGKILLIPNISCVRCNVHSPHNLSEGLQIIGKIGKNSKEYAYLDEQIITHLKSDSGLFIVADTSKIHSIKFEPEKPYPKAIVAIELNIEDKPFGLFWMGYEEAIDVTHDDFSFYQEIGEGISSVLEKNFAWYEKSLINEVTFKLFECLDYPIMVFIDRGLIYKNQKADEIINSLLSNKQGKKVSQNEIYELFKGIIEGEEKFLVIGNHQYDVPSVQLQENDLIINAISLIDHTLDKKRQELGAVIIETIALSLRPSITHCYANLKMLSLIGDLNTNQISYIDNTKEVLDGISQIVDDLSIIDRFTSQQGLVIQSVKPDEVIKHIVGMMQQKSKQKRIEIKYAEQSPVAQIFIDKILFTQCLFFIFEFAVARSKMGGIILVEEIVNEDGWELIINDASRGMSQGEIDQIFSPQNKSEKDNGILLASRIIKYLGGSLSIKSNLGYGCQIISRFPKRLFK